MNKFGRAFRNILIAVSIIGVTYTSIIYYYNRNLGIVCVISLIIFMALISYMTGLFNKDIKKDIKNLEISVEYSAKETLLSFPFPIAKFKVNGEDGEIEWKNEIFEATFPEVLKINQIIKDDDLAYMISARESKEVIIEDYTYMAVIRRIDAIESFKHYILYLIDRSDYFELLRRYEDEKKVVAIIFVDNYFELSESTSEKDAEIFSIVDKKLNKWAHEISGVIKKYDRDKYIFIFDKKRLEEFKEDKFSILDEVRSIDTNNEIPLTLSIGVGDGGSDMYENYGFARSAIELALGRGGDHAVIKNAEKLTFYGGKTKEVEKRSKVRARVIAHAMIEMINQSDRCIIMGHKLPDMDCLGAAIGLSRGVRYRGKPVNIVLSSVTPSIEALMGKIKKMDEFKDMFISPDQALNLATDSTLVIVVDTHRPNSVECPELLDKEDRIIIIDHHRRGRDFIENAFITYLEPYASSSCELVSELIQYMGEGIKLSVQEAEALLAGIIVDTKNFCFKTGVRTFEAASFLRKQGANSAVVRQLFQNDLDTFLDRYEIVRNVEIFNENIAIAVSNKDNENSTLVIAQAADELLTIQGIKASFVLSRVGEEIFISGRSFGDINVQAIMESLGGGGHFTVAGAQLKDTTIQDAIKNLKESILNVNQE